MFDVDTNASTSLSPHPDEVRHTDLGNATRFISNHGSVLRYCHTWRKWLVWDGKRWLLDNTGTVYRLAQETVRAMYTEAAQLDDGPRQALCKHAIRSEAENRINAMISVARVDARVVIESDALDTDQWKLNVLNGTVDLRTGKLLPHFRREFHTKLAPVSYGETAECPRWLGFIEEVIPDSEVRAFLQRAVGYTLTGTTGERVMFILHGCGANGKSTFLEVSRLILGDYAKQADVSTFLAKRGNGLNNDVARLAGARFVASSEVEEGRSLAEGLVKSLTGNDTVTARYLYGEFFEFRPTFKWYLATNHKPTIRGTDNAIWDRIRLVPFTVTIEPERQNKQLLQDLREELPGILAWAVDGCLAWQERGLDAPEAVRQATESYRDEMDVVSHFTDDHCRLAKNGQVRASEIYQAYRAWSEARGDPPMSQTKFGSRLADRGYQRDKDRQGWYYMGLTLRETYEQVTL